MTERETTSRLRELCSELHRVRQRTGRSQADLARTLGWSTSRMSRLETGALGTTPVLVAQLLTACHITGTEFDRILTLSTNVLDRSWLRFPHGHILHDQQSLSHHDTTAARITEYAPLAIPELLQTEPYFRTRLTTAGLTPDTVIDDTVRAHQARQVTLNQTTPPVALTFFIAEHALRSPTGPPHVMTDQLDSLLIASRCPGYTIRILPESLGPTGLLGGPFRLLEYNDDLPAVQLTTHTATLFLQEPTDTVTYRHLHTRLGTLALDDHQSRDLLVNLAAQHHHPEPTQP